MVKYVCDSYVLYHSPKTNHKAYPLSLALLTLSWDKNWDSHSPMNGYPSFYPRIALVAPSPCGHAWIYYSGTISMFSHCSSFEDRVPVDGICGYPIYLRVRSSDFKGITGQPYSISTNGRQGGVLSPERAPMAFWRHNCWCCRATKSNFALQTQSSPCLHSILNPITTSR